MQWKVTTKTIKPDRGCENTVFARIQRHFLRLTDLKIIAFALVVQQEIKNWSLVVDNAKIKHELVE